uniref:tensin-3-like isoform X2 n=2 Tax=Myxine glutinosa TaxID=7769 RepID=UPI00358FEFD8
MGCRASRLGWRNRQHNESGEPSCGKDLSLPARRLEPGRPAGVHSFIKLSLGVPACCSVCQQTVRAHGRVCRVCKFVCHSQCVVKVVTQCVLPMAFHLVTPTTDKSSETRKQPIESHRDLERDQAPNHSWGGVPLFHLAYVTERIICIIFQENCPAGAYLEALRDVAQMLLSKHGEKHLVINLSENDVDLRQMNLKVQDVSWPDGHAPQISQLCLLVKYMNAWLISDPQNAVILNCKGHWGSVSTAVAAYMCYNDICSGSQEPLDKFSMKRFYDDKLSSSLLPSQKRYLQFFGDLLAKTYKVREKAICVQLMILRGVLPVGAGCKVFLKAFQGLQLLHTSPVYIVPMGSPGGHLCVSFSPGLTLQGDILVKCFWAVSESGAWETLFQVQFHTGALHKSSLVLGKDQLEHAYNDSSFPDGGSVEFLFAGSPKELPEVEGPLYNDPSVVVDTSMTDPFLHKNSHPEPGLVLPPHDVPTRSEPGRSTMETHGALSVLSEHALSLSSDSGRSTASCRTDELRSPVTLSSDSSTPSPFSTSSTQPDSQGEGTTTSWCSPGKLTTEQQDSLIELLRTFDVTLNSVEDTRENSDDLEISPHLLPQSPQKVHFNDLSVTLERETDILDDEMNAANEVLSMGSLGTLSSLEGACVSANRKGSQDSLHTDSTGYSTVVEESNGGPSPSLLLPPAFGSSFSQGRMAAGAMNPRGVTIAVGQSALVHPRQTVKFEATAPKRKTTLPKKELGEYHGRSKEVVDYGTLNEILSSPASIPTSKSQPVVPVRGKSSQQAVRQGIQFVAGLSGNARHMRQDHMRSDNPAEYRISQEEEELDQSLNELHKMIMDLDPTYIPPSNSTCTHSPNSTESCSSSPSVGGDLFQHRQLSGTCSSFSGLDSSSQCHIPEHGLMPVPRFTSHSLGSASSSSYNTLLPPSLSRYHSLKPASAAFGYNSLKPAPSSSYNNLRVVPPSSYNSLRPAAPFNYNSMRPVPPFNYNSLRPAPPSSYSRSWPTPSSSFNSLRPAPPSSYSTSWPTPSSSFNSLWPPPPPSYSNSLLPVPPSISNMEPWQSQTYETLHQQSDQSSSRTLGLMKNQEASQISDQEERSSGNYRTLPGHKNTTQSPSLTMKSEAFQPSVCKTRKQGPPARHLTADIWHPYGAKVNLDNSKPQQCNFVSTLGIQDHIVAKQEEKGNMKDPVLDICFSFSPGSEELLSTDSPSPQSTVARMLPNSTHFFPHEAKTDMRVQDLFEVTSQTIDSGTNKEAGTNLQVEGKCSDSSLVRFVRDSPTYNVAAYEQSLEDTLKDHEGLHGCKETSPSSPNYVSMNGTIFKTGSFPGSRKVSFPNSFPHTLPRRSPGAPQTKALEWNSEEDLKSGITSTFVQDTSKFWYKPRITREQAIAILKHQQPGAFVIRDSTSFCGAFGLAMRVSAAQACLKHHNERDSDPIRHFLIESTTKGVQLKGSTQEPIFGSLSALIYQHSITALSLPCKLLIPEKDLEEKLTAPSDCQLLKEDCTSLYLGSIDLESLTGPRAIAKAVSEVLDTFPRPISTPVFLRISSQGVTLTDNHRRLFFRKHYMANSIIYCSSDPEDRRWEATKDLLEPRIFGFIARKERNYRDNVCHLFAENSAERPASIIISAIKDLMSQSTGE